MSFRPTPGNRGARHYHFAAGCLLAALSCAVPLFADPTYTVIQVPGAVRTWAQSINLFGTVAGSYRDANNSGHGFVRDPSGKITTFDVPGSTSISPYCINIAGTIAGNWWDANGIWHSFMRDSKGKVTAFDPPQSAGRGSAAFGINAEGTIVGTTFGPGGSSYVRNPDGTFLVLDVKDSQFTEAFGINVAYLVTGTYLSAIDYGYHGFVARPNNQLLATFDAPGSTSTNAISINWVGAVAGQYRGADNFYHGFVRDPQGKIVSFDPVGSIFTYPMAINDAGAIGGWFNDSNYVSHGFVRDPHGAITAIDPPGSTSSEAADINDVGVIVGWFSTDGNKTSVGFVRTP